MWVMCNTLFDLYFSSYSFKRLCVFDLTKILLGSKAQVINQTLFCYTCYYLWIKKFTTALQLHNFFYSSVCPKTIKLPRLPSNMVCTHHEKCLGFDCCVELDIKVTTLSTRFWFILDPCQFEITMGLGEWSYNISIFSYDWGKPESLSIGEPLQIGYV